MKLISINDMTNIILYFMHKKCKIISNVRIIMFYTTGSCHFAVIIKIRFTTYANIIFKFRNSLV